MKRLLSTIALLGLAGVAAACFAPLPLEVAIDQADIVVFGEVFKTADIDLKLPRKYQAAVVKVEKVLKGQADLKEVKIAQPAPGGMAVSTDMHWKEGTKGIWMLAKDKKHDVYWAHHPIQFQPDTEKDKVEKLVAERAKIKGGKPVSGLEARVEVKQEGDSAQLVFSLKNVSDKPITVCKYPGARLLDVVWHGPDNKKCDAKPYDWLNQNPPPPLGEHDFVTIQPGAAVFIDAAGSFNGISISQPDKGEHTFLIRYQNKEDGNAAGVKDVWAGTIETNEVKFVIK